MQKRFAAFLAGISLLICGCANTDITGQASPPVYAEEETALPMIKDTVDLEMRLRTAITKTESTVCGWLPSENAAEILKELPILTQRAVAADALSGMFLREIRWMHLDMPVGCRLTVQLSYDGTQQEILRKKAELLLAVEQWTAQHAMLREDVRLLLLHDVLIRTCTYDSVGESVHTAYGAWLCGTAVCDGYAAAFQIISEKMGIPCIIVTGTVLTDAGAWEPHAWNLVQLYGEWYHIDCTWDDNDDGAPLHTWFLRSDAEMVSTHIWDTEDYPSAVGAAVSYQTILQEMQQ